jgi:universal stress protein A
VLHKVTCPVLTIPEAGDEPGSADRVRSTHVLCAVDFSPSSRAALAQGLSFAEENEAKVSVLHVLEPLSKDEAVAAWLTPLGELVQRRRDEALDQLHTFLPGELHAGSELARLVELGGAARTILRVADEINADLIAMGVRGRTALGRILIGSTTDTVVRHAACPVLTARA